MIHQKFFENWDTWFIGDFSLMVAHDNLNLIKRFLVTPGLGILKKTPEIWFCGPYASLLGDRGIGKIPHQLQRCHVAVFLPKCPEIWVSTISELAKQSRTPVMYVRDSSVIEQVAREWIETYYIPSVWAELCVLSERAE